MNYNAQFFCKLFVDTARASRTGLIPRDTGLTQDFSINTLYAINNSGSVGIGGEKGLLAYYDIFLENSEFVGRSSVINKHKGFVEKFILTEFITALRKYGEVTIKNV